MYRVTNHMGITLGVHNIYGCSTNVNQTTDQRYMKTYSGTIKNSRVYNTTFTAHLAIRAGPTTKGFGSPMYGKEKDNCEVGEKRHQLPFIFAI